MASALSPTGEVAVVCGDRQLLVASTEGQVRGRQRIGDVSHLSWSGDGERILAARRDEIGILEGDRFITTSLPDGLHVKGAMGLADGWLLTVQRSFDEIGLARLGPEASLVWSFFQEDDSWILAAPVADGKQVAASIGGTVRTYDAGTGKELAEWALWGEPVPTSSGVLIRQGDGLVLPLGPSGPGDPLPITLSAFQKLVASERWLATWRSSDVGRAQAGTWAPWGEAMIRVLDLMGEVETLHRSWTGSARRSNFRRMVGPLC